MALSKAAEARGRHRHDPPRDAPHEAPWRAVFPYAVGAHDGAALPVEVEVHEELVEHAHVAVPDPPRRAPIQREHERECGRARGDDKILHLWQHG